MTAVYTLILMYGAAISLLRDREGLLAVLLAVCLISALVLAAIGRRIEEEELSTFSQQWNLQTVVVGIFLHPRNRIHSGNITLADRSKGPRGKGLSGYASQSPRLDHPYNGLS